MIVGSGWAGATISTALDERKYKITVVSPEETTPYTPLLASAACGLYDFRYATHLPAVIEIFWSNTSDS